MTTSCYNISQYSRFNLSENESDIHVFVKEYKERIKQPLGREECNTRSTFVSFAEKRLSATDVAWLQDNEERFFRDTANETLTSQCYRSEYGFISSMIYSADGEFIIVGHASGLIQAILAQYATSIQNYYENEEHPTIWYPMFYEGKSKKSDQFSWVQENYNRFMKGTRNEVMYYRWFSSEMGAITALEYSPNGAYIIVGHSSGLIQMRHGSTGTLIHTLRNTQFPPKPVYALEYSKTEERICYAACMDGAVYRIEIPQTIVSVEDPPQFCIRADPALECLNMQFYGTPGISSYATPFVTQRSPALSFGLTADGTKMVVGYGDASIKLYDMETQEADLTYKVHKLRLQFIPPKLQRMHFAQVCAIKCHEERPFVFASAAWDKTLRIWDTRCSVGCVITFEGVDICSDSIDLNRDHCLAGSWQTTEALTLWDLAARKKLSVIRAQNRRPDVDGEYIYACRYWNSTDYNRKGKYAIIGGSGTNCLEVINLHNRYITCSYPATGTILAVTSHQNRIAYGGTAPTFTIAKFFDPKHEQEKYEKEIHPDFDYANAIPIFEHSYEDNISESTPSDFQSTEISMENSEMSKMY